MTKEVEKIILKHLNKEGVGVYDRLNLTLEECDKLYNKGISVEKGIDSMPGIYGDGWTVDTIILRKEN